MDLATAASWWDLHNERYLSQLREFLSFQSISTDPAFKPACGECAKWVCSHLESIGFQSELKQTETLPVVFARYRVSSTAPTVVVYGHYDVQPPGDLSDWTSPPFEPHVRDGRIYARGAVDNKGQLFFVIKALENLIAHKALTCNITLVVEGEEESGSGGLSAKLPEWKNELAGDVLLVCDTGMPSGKPTIMVGLRGIAGLTFELHGPARELHSGYHGNLAKNPALHLAKILAAMTNADGSVAVPGFYDGIAPVDDSLRALINSQPFDPIAYEQETGCPPTGGEATYPVAERVGLRPSIDIHGILSGYAGPGIKTIVPPWARATLSTRLVLGQKPQRIIELLEYFIRERTPTDMRLKVIERDLGGPALLVSPEHPTLKLCASVLTEVFEVPPVYRCHGASIPVLSELAHVSGAQPVIAGFSLESDRLHASNESFGLDRMRRGFLYICRFLSRLTA